MAEKVGNIFYEVNWYLGFNPGDKYWDEDCDESDIEKATFELETYRVRSVRCPPRRRVPWKRDPSNAPKQVTAFVLSNLLTVNAKGEWNLHPEILLRKQWRVGKRPRTMARTKSAAYRAAIAAVRSSSEYCPNSEVHIGLLGRLKGQMKRFS